MSLTKKWPHLITLKAKQANTAGSPAKNAYLFRPPIPTAVFETAAQFITVAAAKPYKAQTPVIYRRVTKIGQLTTNQRNILILLGNTICLEGFNSRLRGMMCERAYPRL